MTEEKTNYTYAYTSTYIYIYINMKMTYNILELDLKYLLTNSLPTVL